MCGIFIVIQKHPLWQSTILMEATDALSHRGPDGQGYWQENGVFLGHRRLSIIDLNTGDQPMFSHDRRYVIVFNGEIYNYRELRIYLQQAGHHFCTASDTEIILEAYRRWGDNCLQQLNGMFAFALWDREQQRLLAARDRLGIKPLCWTLHRGALIISSTLEPLWRLPDLPRKLDYEGLRDVLVFDYIPAPRTILQGVQKLPAGHFLNWQLGQSEPVIRSYWQVPRPRHENLPPREELESRVEILLDQAVRRQMIADVPLGAFLSGGIDSSLVVALMARHSPKPVKTFSISFQDKGYDESPYAQAVAQTFATEHTVWPAEKVDGDQLLDIIGRLDEPFADPTLIPTFALSALTRRQVTVALSGDGGDEVFGGYQKYLQYGDDGECPSTSWLRPVKWLAEFLPVRPRGVGRFYPRALTPLERIPFNWVRYGNFPLFRKDLRQVLSASAADQVKAEAYFEPWRIHARRFGNNYSTDLLMRTDLTTYLSGNCLVKTDRASMMNSLEVRVPYLDELLLDFVLPFPATVKIVRGQLKSLLISLAQKLLPQESWDRPKQGFNVPIGKYLATDWAPWVDRLLNWGQAHLPLFNYPYLQKLVKINRGSQDMGSALWNPLVILIWYYHHAAYINL